MELKYKGKEEETQLNPEYFLPEKSPFPSTFVSNSSVTSFLAFHNSD